MSLISDLKRGSSKMIALTVFIILLLIFAGQLISEDAIALDLSRALSKPSLEHWFGTDWIGRDMFFRTIKGLSLSIQIGLICAFTSGLIAVILGLTGPMVGGFADELVNWLIELVLSVPHTLIIIVVSLAVGGGVKGVVLGIILTHWTTLAKVIRAEVIQINTAEYTQLAYRLGKSRLYVAKAHVMPHVLPQILIGTVLIFPHAILHEAAITFLGFGLQAHEPAIGIILSESMKYMTSGSWWLSVLPGICLISVSMLVQFLGKQLEVRFNAKELLVEEPV